MDIVTYVDERGNQYPALVTSGVPEEDDYEGYPALSVAFVNTDGTTDAYGAALTRRANVLHKSEVPDAPAPDTPEALTFVPQGFWIEASTDAAEAADAQDRAISEARSRWESEAESRQDVAISNALVKAKSEWQAQAEAEKATAVEQARENGYRQGVADTGAVPVEGTVPPVTDSPESETPNPTAASAVPSEGTAVTE